MSQSYAKSPAAERKFTTREMVLVGMFAAVLAVLIAIPIRKGINNAGNIMHAIPVMMNWKIIHLPQQHRKKLILFYAETVAGNLHFRNTKKAAALTATQDLIQNAVYMRIFISVVQIQGIQNSKKFCILFLFVKKSDILIRVRIN